MGLRKLEGKGTLTVDLDSTGGSVYELAQGLNGTASLASLKGAVAGLNLEQLLKRFERSPLAVRGDFRSGKTQYDQLTADLRIIKGAAGIEEARLDAPALRLALVGSASIPARDFDLKGVASLVAARDTAPAFELPFVITGPWDSPLVLPDTQALFNRAGAPGSLIDAVRNKLKRGGAPAELPVPPDAQPAAAPR
jgi:AsmA protein